MFVHSDGKVTEQYINVCKEHEVNISNVKLGQRLHVNHDYFKLAYYSIITAGIRFFQLMWRKFLPNQIEVADNSLNNIAYEILQYEHWETALSILEFATGLKKYASNESEKHFVINYGIALKWGEKPKVSLKVHKWQGLVWNFR